MAILASIAAGIASFFLAVLVACKIHDVFKDRWTEKRIDLVSAVFCFALIGSSAYAMVGFRLFSFGFAIAIHLGIGLFFVAIVLLGVMNYVEGFVLATIVCILISLLVPAVQKAREVHDRRTQSLEYRSPNTVWPQSCGIHAANAFVFHSTGARVESVLGWPTSFVSIRGGVGHTTRWAIKNVSNDNLYQPPDDPSDDSPNRPNTSAFPIRGFVTILGIFIGSLIAGNLPGPADPISSWFFTLIIFPVALIAFALGLHYGPKLSGKHRKLVYISVPVLIALTAVLAYFELIRVFPR